MKSRVPYCLASLMLLAVSHVSAQATGVLRPKLRAGGIYEPSNVFVRANVDRVTGDSLMRIYGDSNITAAQQQQFGVLLADPMLRSGVRASSWSAALTSAATGAEVRIQLNICDVTTKACANAKSAAYATLIGPLGKNEQPTDLVNVDGFLGTTRLEAGWTVNATDAVMKPTVTFKAGLARPEFIYRPDVASAPDTVERLTHSIGGDVAFKSKTVLLAIGAKFEDSYKSKPTITICPPASASPTTCSNAVVGAPASATTSLFTIESRTLLTSSVASAILVTRDTKANVTVVEVPFWFVPPADTNKDLFGGIRINYRSDTNRSAVTVFISARKI